MKARIGIIAVFSALVVGCAPLESGDDEGSASSSGPYLYIASGTTYAGNGITAATASNTVVRYKLNGGFDALVMDYTANPGDSPVGLADYDADHLLVLVENTSGRRIDKVAKDGSSSSSFLVNSTAFSAVLRSLVPTADGGWLVSKSSAIEKFSSTKARVTSGANPYVSAPAAPCATSTTLIPSVVQGPGDTIVYAHAAASPNNKIGQIKSTGYSAASDCLSSQSGATTNHFPTALLYHSSSGRLLAGFGNNTGPVHAIYSYPITSTTISAGSSAYSNTSVLQGISTMVELPDGTILVAAMASTFNSIEQFTYDSTTHQLSRVGSSAFIGPSVYTKSVSALLVAD